MRKILAGALVMTGLLAVGCSGDDENNSDEATAVCTDRNGVRVDDSQCGSPDRDGQSTFLWFYMLSSLNQPAYGAQVVHNTYYVQNNTYGFHRPPQSVPVVRNVPKQGAPAKSLPHIPAPKPAGPQDKPNPNIKPGGPVNPAPAAPRPAPPAKR